MARPPSPRPSLAGTVPSSSINPDTAEPPSPASSHSFSSDPDALSATALFREPTDFYASEAPATHETYTLRSGAALRLRLVGHSPLWGHHLWNGGREMASYLEAHADTLELGGRTVLELGAGAALPSLVAALLGARDVVASDYPDHELVENMRWNFRHALVGDARDGEEDGAGSTAAPSAAPLAELPLRAEGYLWGAPLPPAFQPANRFSLVLLADVVFNHSEHEKLADTVAQTMARGAAPPAVALVFFTPYRPWLLQRDLDFFRVAEIRGLAHRKLFERRLEKHMFERDPGDEELRRTVFAFELFWAGEGGSGVDSGD